MPLGPGSRLDGYELVRPLGSGGMGEVWVATELRLGRRVALKLLPVSLTADRSRVGRFEQEARAASALSHPNVCTIYALGETGHGQRYIAMELVEGVTLRARLAGERVSVRDALDIALQIAFALADAHRSGIVHRDVKPENVMLRPDGLVKVLDFGLAKLDSGDSAPAGMTQTAFRTETGTFLGTVAYISPEQARGQPIDARTDVWALGTVLYEMVAGRSPFAASSNSDTLAAILGRDPLPLTRVDPDVPAELQRILTKALRKDRAQRYQTMQDLLLDLQALRADLADPAAEGGAAGPYLQTQHGRESSSGTGARARSRRWRATTAAVLVLALSIAAAAAWWLRLSQSSAGGAAAPLHRPLTRVTVGPGLQTDPAFSPDGRFVAYASDRNGNFDIWVQPVGGGEPVQVTRSPAHDMQPAWSPDGNRIAFRSDRERGGIFIVPALGGIEQQVAEFGSHPRWTSDGKELVLLDGLAAGEAFWPMRIVAVSLETGRGRALLGDFLEGGDWFWGAPHPDGRISVWGSHRSRGIGFFTVSTDGRDVVESQEAPDSPIQLAEAAVSLRRRFTWNASGTALYLQTEVDRVYNLWRVRVDPATLAWQAAERLTTGAGSDVSAALSADATRLAFVTEQDTSRLWAFPLGPEPDRVGDGRPLTEDGATASFGALSPDGRSVAYNLARRGSDRSELWIADIDGGRGQLVATHAAIPVWSPDGRALAYLQVRPGSPAAAVGGRESRAIVVRDAGGQERFVSDWISTLTFVPSSWLRDGRLLGTHVPFPDRRDGWLAVWPTSGARGQRPERMLVAEPGAQLWQARISPNGRWITFVSSGRASELELFVAPLDDPGAAKWARIAAGHRWPDKPRWSSDGRFLYFISRQGARYFNLWGVQFDPDRGAVVGQPFAITSFDSPGLHVSPDIQTSEIDVSARHVLLTMKSVSGSVWMIDHLDR